MNLYALTLLLIYLLNFNLLTNAEERVRLYEEWFDPVEHIKSKEELFDLIPRDDGYNEGTTNAIILYIYDDNCDDGLTNPIFVGAHYQTGPGILFLATLNKNIYRNIEYDWNLQRNCSHFIWIPPNKFYNDYQEFDILNDQRLPSMTRWINENRRTSVTFKNDCNFDIDFYWYEKDPVFLATLKPGQTRQEQTFLGHIFLAKHHETNEFIDAWNVERPNEISIIPRHNWCSSQGITEGTNECDKAIEDDIVGWTYEFWARKREALNYAQPKILRNLTRMGFKLTHLPDNLYQPILNFWNSMNNEESLLVEHYAGPVLNQYTSPTYMAHLHQRERELLINYFRDVLGKWSNIPSNKLEMTSLYGIRKYVTGAILGMHVDTCRTHVVSAIINVDSRLTPNGKDWPLQIYDHNDHLHSFTMKPGDVVFYESAKCGHARFEPLDGEWYANVFIHFAPTDHSDWDCSWF